MHKDFKKYKIIALFLSIFTFINANPYTILTIHATHKNESNATIAFVGDLMVHKPQMVSAYNKSTDSYDFNYCFSKVEKYLKTTDMTVGNLETTFAGNEIGYSDYPCFNTPDTFAEALKKAGISLLTTANNHSNDKREAGILRTLDVLDKLGFDHVGTYRSQEERDHVFIKDINNIRFAFLSYTYSTNGIPLPEGKDYLVNMLDEQLIKKDIAKAKKAKPDIIVVLPHMGNEYETAPNDTFKQYAKMMAEAGADVIIASHPHVIQPMEFIEVTDKHETTRDCFVAYSMGNFVSSQRTKPRDAGMILNISFKKAGNKTQITSVSYIPTWVKYTNTSGQRDMIVLPVFDTLKAVENGERIDLRPNDLQRIISVNNEIAMKILGTEVHPADIAPAYYYKIIE